MDGGDDATRLTELDNEGKLSEQVNELEREVDFQGLGGEVVGFQCFLTADGKGMQATNWEKGRKCWVCTDKVEGPPGTEEGIEGEVRYGAFLRTIPVSRRIGDCAHATARIGTAILRRLEDLAEEAGRGRKAHVATIRGWLTQEALKLPAEERLGQARGPADALDLTQGAILASSWPVMQQVVQVAGEALPDKRFTFQGREVGVSVLLFRLLSAWHRMHQWWCSPVPLSQEEVQAYGSLVQDFASAWGALGWGATPWVHWVTAHSVRAMHRWRTLTIFSSVPVEHRHKGFKRDLANTFLGYKLTRPLLSARGLVHILHLDALDLPLWVRATDPGTCSPPSNKRLRTLSS